MKVLKRNGKLETFSTAKIVKAIDSAYKACGKETSKEVIKKIESFPISTESDVIGIETVQDYVEKTLMDLAPYDVAKAYILYRETHKNARFVRERLDYMKKYVTSDDNASTASETDANANVTVKNVANLEGEVYKITNRVIQRQRMKDMLNRLFPEVANQYSQDIDNHIIYAHDESQTPTHKPYCMAATLYPLMIEGTGGIDGVTPSAPNDIQSFSGQVTNLMFMLSSQVRGAVAMGDYIVALNYYVIKEFGEEWYNILDKEISSDICRNKKTVKDAIRKGMKQFIYGINQPAGNRSFNSPFSNLNFFDNYYFTALFENFYYPDGTKPTWKAIDTLQRIFMELLRELRLIKPLTFPVTSVCMLHDNNDCLDQECKKWVAEEWSKGSSFFLYLSNNPDSISSCCRVQNEIKDNTFNSTIGLTGIMTGSVNVITLNLNRIVQNFIRERCGDYFFAGTKLSKIAYPKLCKYLTNILERVYKYQIAYKTLCYDMEDKGMYSCSNAKYIFMKKLFCTIGVIGYCEAAQFLGMKISNNDEYKEFLKTIFGTIQDENKRHSINDPKRPFVFNLEAIPGENLAVKLYDWDKADGYWVPEDQNLYSSYFFKQWDKNISVLDKIKLHGRDINTYCGGGQASHLHMEEHLSYGQYLKMIDVAVHEGCNYFTFNIPMSECKDCGHIVNAPIKECPKCKSKNIDWWVRIIGFLRPISSYSAARQIEASKRVYSKIESK